MNLEQMRAKLEELQNRSASSSNAGSTEYMNRRWKPSDGSEDIRLLPYKHSADGSFVMQGFYYLLFNNKVYLAPGFSGKPDPVFEFCRELRDIKGRSKEEWWADIQIVNKLEPNIRFIAPVLVRGKESEGVKFWEFGQKVFNKIKAIVDNPDYADIVDMEEGTDLTITYTKNEEDIRKSETEIIPRRKSSKATTDVNVLESINSMPNVLDFFEEPTYDDLKRYLEDYLKYGQKGTAKTTEPVKPAENPEPIRTNITASDDASKMLGSIDDVEAEFAKILEGKK